MKRLDLLSSYFLGLQLLMFITLFVRRINSNPINYKNRINITSQRLKQNLIEAKNYYDLSGYKIIEGDILIEENEEPSASSTTSNNKEDDQVQNSGIAFQTSRWPNAQIPYVISNDFGAWERNVIYDAMNEITASTCIKFYERTNQHHFVFIQKHYGRICNSVVGRSLHKTPQLMTLGEGCINHWTVLHELVHSIGFYHEHNRVDRDNYVTILWDNIAKGNHHDFQKQGNSYDFGVGYDYGSIMHYASTHFGYAGRITMIAKQPGVIFGTARHLSFRDKLKINRMYNCGKNS